MTFDGRVVVHRVGAWGLPVILSPDALAALGSAREVAAAGLLNPQFKPLTPSGASKAAPVLKSKTTPARAVVPNQTTRNTHTGEVKLLVGGLPSPPSPRPVKLLQQDFKACWWRWGWGSGEREREARERREGERERQEAHPPHKQRVEEGAGDRQSSYLPRPRP